MLLSPRIYLGSFCHIHAVLSLQYGGGLSTASWLCKRVTSLPFQDDELRQPWVQAGDKKKWRAMIQHNHEQHHVGYYPTAEEAARAYDRKALLFMGPSAITNFPAADYDGVNLEADGSVEEQVRPCTAHPVPLPGSE